MNTVEDVLEHFGVPGMRWGVRKKTGTIDVRSRDTGHRTTIKFDRTKARISKDSDGKLEISTNSRRELNRIQKQIDKHPSDDAVLASRAKTKIRKSGIQSLNNKELQSLVTRMNLEQQFDRLSMAESSSISKGTKAVQTILNAGKTINDVVGFVNSPAGQFVKKMLLRG